MRWAFAVVCLCVGQLGLAPAYAEETRLRYFPTGPIYEYRWKLLELALSYTKKSPSDTIRLEPYAEDVSQNRGMKLLQSGDIDVIALGTNAEREDKMQPIKIDILRGIVGYRLLVVRAADQARIARMDSATFKTQLTFGLNSQWADLPIMRANGYTVLTSADYEGLFSMLTAGRFDAFPRGLNEAGIELKERSAKYPQLAIEKTKAFYVPYPVYFWVNKKNTALARRIEQGLKQSLADGSFQKMFESHHAAEIEMLVKEKREVIRLTNSLLPPGSPEPDTSWWWR